MNLPLVMPLAEAAQEFDPVVILQLYAVTFGWAFVGALSMGIAIIFMLKVFTWSTTEIDEWEEVKKGNIAVAIIMSSVILGAALVVSFCVKP